MGDLLSPAFWIAAAVLVVILGLVRRRRTILFGALNLIVIGVWMGWPLALAAAAFSAALWLVVWVASRPGIKHAWSAVCVLLIVVVMFILHKVNIEYTETAESWLQGGPWALPSTVLVPLAALSFSYVALRAYSMCYAVLFQSARLTDPISVAGFLFPFHMLISGPIARYEEHLKCAEVTTGEPVPQRLLGAGNDIATGLVYKYVISEYMRVFAYGAGAPIVVTGYWDTAYLLVFIFFDFAGYSRIALGIGRLMGIATPQNFRAPFLSRTATEFFTRWHISLGDFIKRDLYMPMQLHLVRRWGTKRAVWAGLLALLVSWIVVGLWHRISPTFMAYGLVLAVWLWLEKLVRDRVLRHDWSRSRAVQWAAAVVGPIYVFFTLCAMLTMVVQEILGA